MKWLIPVIILIFKVCTVYPQANSDFFKVFIDGKGLNPHEVLSLYIQKKSVTGEEKSAGEWIRNVCRENGLHITDFGEENGNFNFSASLYPLDGKRPVIVLLNHIDVVHEGDCNLWQYPPYSGTITEKEVWGRGSHDNKGTAIMQLFGLLGFKAGLEENESPYNISFLSVSCEETMCAGGVDHIVHNYLTLLNPVVVIGEGVTELNSIIESKKEEPLFGISLAHKRPLWIELRLDIVSSGHGSVTPLEYANKEMIKALYKLVQKETPFIYTKENKTLLRNIGNHTSGFSKWVLHNPVFFKSLLRLQLKEQPGLYSLFTNTVTITSVQSGFGMVNQVPNHITATLDCRLLPEYPSEKTLEFIRKALDNDKIEIKVLQSTEPVVISGVENVHYQNLKAAIEDIYTNATVIPVILPVFNETGKFQAKGIHAYSITPLQLETEHLHCIHAENERIPIQALQKGSQVYLKFLEYATVHGSRTE